MSWNSWIRTVEIEPSLYAADFRRLGEQIEVLLRAGARVFHFDVGDGHFVEPITAGPVVMKSISPLIHAESGVLDCHLMVESPERHLAMFKSAGADSVTFHYEAASDVEVVRDAARDLDLQVGLAFNPATDVDEVAESADGFDLVLCMSVHPGFSGQAFIPETLDRLRRLRELLPPEVHVQIDGGITFDNVREAYDAGANLIVAGNAIFSMEDLPRAYRRLVHELA
jgi:ribulose-phosphate 3-epimerase